LYLVSYYRYIINNTKKKQKQITYVVLNVNNFDWIKYNYFKNFKHTKKTHNIYKQKFMNFYLNLYDDDKSFKGKD